MMDDDDFIRLLFSIIYGRGHEPSGPAGDPSSLGYAMQGPAAPLSTADDLRVMAHQKAERDREGPEAAARLFTTAMTPFGAAAARSARPIPSPQVESAAERLARYGEAMALHQRGEVKRGNPSGYPTGLGVFAASTAAALSGHPIGEALGIPHMIITQPWSVMMSGHTQDTANIAKYLRGLKLREAAKQPPPDNSGFTLYGANRLPDLNRSEEDQ